MTTKYKRKLRVTQCLSVHGNKQKVVTCRNRVASGLGSISQGCGVGRLMCFSKDRS